jgi:outer membrane PBP1 activator LpoA protein
MLATLCLTLFLGACGGVSFKPKTVEYKKPEKTQRQTGDARSILAKASSLPPEQRHIHYVQAAESYWHRENYELAIQLLQTTRTEYLDYEHLGIYSLLYGRWALDQQQFVLAENLLMPAHLSSGIHRLPTDLAIALRKVRVEYLSAVFSSSELISERIALQSLLTDSDERRANQSSIWSSLRMASSEELSKLSPRSNRQLSGWLELVSLADSNHLDIDEQALMVENWLRRWPQHPASSDLPVEIELLRNAPARRPARITLLLPVTGPLASASQAFIEGFTAAYYQALQQGKPVPMIDIVDSHKQDFASLYHNVSQSGTNLIIGPLGKGNVGYLADEKTIPVPTLALNYAQTTDTRPTSNLYQYGLNPRDEARQAAEYGLQNRYQKALLITPEGDWGERLSLAYAEYWEKRGGIILGNARFNPASGNHSQVIEKALGISDSKARYQSVRYYIPDRIEFEPRRRQDLDVIFLAGQPEDARQIKPLLAFHFAGDVPVVATSSVYDPNNAIDRETDLNGIHFTAMPWQISDSPIKTSLETTVKLKGELDGLYAMGIDAWQIHSRIPVLAGSPDSKINGQSGTLRLDEDGRIYRQQTWATIRNGRVILIPSIIN